MALLLIKLQGKDNSQISANTYIADFIVAPFQCFTGNLYPPHNLVFDELDDLEFSTVDHYNQSDGIKLTDIKKLDEKS